ncbi:MAG TPA: S41 family peptidase [Chthoniobacterales bacterium]
MPSRRCLLVILASCQLCSAWGQGITPLPSPSTALKPDLPDPETRKLIETLQPDQVQKLLAELQARYASQAPMTNQEVNQATLEGWLGRLGPEVTLEPAGAETGPPKVGRPFHRETVYGQFGYLRPGALNPDVIPAVDDALHGFRAQNVSGLVLDLRMTPAGDNLQTATAFASRFLPDHTLAFATMKAKTPQEQFYTAAAGESFTGPLAILVDHGVAGAAEALAATLRRYAHALIIGGPTAGRPLRYDHIPVGGNLQLRVAAVQVQVPDYPDLSPGGLKPDVEVTVPSADWQAILQVPDAGSVMPFVAEDERPRTNEAALVAGKNPDLDAYEQQQANRGRPIKPRDVPLQRALDFLTTILFFRGANNP